MQDIEATIVSGHGTYTGQTILTLMDDPNRKHKQMIRRNKFT